MTTTTRKCITRRDQVSENENPPNSGNWSVNVSVHSDVDWSGFGWQDVKITNKDPLWRDKLKKGTDASQYYKRSGVELSWKPLSGATKTLNPGSFPFNTRGYFSDTLLSSHPARVTTDSTVRDIALSRVKRRIASLEESYQALIPLAELREARGLFRQMVDMTIDTVKVIADLKRTKGKSAFRYAQDRWLIYSFGISPMIADLKGLGASMWAYLTKGDVRDRVQGTMGRDFFSATSGDSIAGLLGAPIRYSAEARHQISYRYVAGWKFLIRSSTDYGMLAHLGFKPAALVPALWETTAYSWVVDYFTTAGDWLEDVFLGSAGSSMYVVEDRKYQYRSVMTQEYYISNPALAVFTKHQRGQVVVDFWEFERTPLSALPSRTLRFKTVDEIGNHALTKLLNLASLTFRGKRWKDL
jgi:hypothetical protein